MGTKRWREPREQTPERLVVKRVLLLLLFVLVSKWLVSLGERMEYQLFTLKWNSTHIKLSIVIAWRNLTIGFLTTLQEAEKKQSQDDIERISKVTSGAPIEMSSNSLGRRTIASLQEIERNRQLHLAKQGQNYELNNNYLSVACSCQPLLTASYPNHTLLRLP